MEEGGVPAARPRGARRRSPQVRGLRERCAAAPRGRWAEGPLLSPRSLLRRAGRRRPSPGLSSGGRAAGNGLGAPPPRLRDATAADAAAAASLPRSPRLSSSLPLSASPPCRVAAGTAKRGREGERGSFRRLILSPFFFNGGHRDESRGPLPHAHWPARRHVGPPGHGRRRCRGKQGAAARPTGASRALRSGRLPRWEAAI